VARFRWAYVDCSGSDGGQAAGPGGSVQFLTGANATSGSKYFVYHSASIGDLPARTLVLTGTLIVSGTISASHYHIKNVTEIDASGSTFFGDSNDDLHIRTGSLEVGKSDGTLLLRADTTTEAVQVRGFRGLYESVSVASYTASAPSYILGVTSTNNVRIEIPSASTYQAGAVMLVKDEADRSSAGTNIILSAAYGTTIDGTNSYTLTGSKPAISLYSNGTNWFVF